MLPVTRYIPLFDTAVAKLIFNKRVVMDLLFFLMFISLEVINLRSGITTPNKLSPESAQHYEFIVFSDGWLCFLNR